MEFVHFGAGCGDGVAEGIGHWEERLTQRVRPTLNTSSPAVDGVYVFESRYHAIDIAIFDGGYQVPIEPSTRPVLWVAPVNDVDPMCSYYKWSGRRDLNSWPLAPQASALPGCATPRNI